MNSKKNYMDYVNENIDINQQWEIKNDFILAKIAIFKQASQDDLSAAWLHRAFPKRHECERSDNECQGEEQNHIC